MVKVRCKKCGAKFVSLDGSTLCKECEVKQELLEIVYGATLEGADAVYEQEKTKRKSKSHQKKKQTVAEGPEEETRKRTGSGYKEYREERELRK